MKKVFKLDFDGREIVVETGELAKQTNGAVFVRYGDTAVLSVCVMGKNSSITRFLSVTSIIPRKIIFGR